MQAVQAQAKGEHEVCFVLARVWSQLGQKEEAERLARRASELNPNRAEIQSFLAGLFIHQDRMAEAAVCLRRALALKPDAPGVARQFQCRPRSFR